MSHVPRRRIVGVGVEVVVILKVVWYWGGLWRFMERFVLSCGRFKKKVQVG